jgi:nitronate monooxygenase
MTISTRLTELLKIQHPIMSAPMAAVADAKLAMAVTKAGGFGILGGGYGDEAWLKRELDAAADAHIGVGFITWSMAKNPRLLDLALERKPAAIMLSFGDVAPHAGKIKRAGALLICQVQTVKHAKAALANGVDILIAQGAEAGGHGDARGTFALVPAVVDAARGVPVAAAGGVADGGGRGGARFGGGDSAALRPR